MLYIFFSKYFYRVCTPCSPVPPFWLVELSGKIQTTGGQWRVTS